MFCTQCGGALMIEDRACRKCGSSTTGSPDVAQTRLAATFDDTRLASRAIARDPTGSIGTLFNQLGSDRALFVGGVFVLLFGIAVTLVGRSAMASLPFGIGRSSALPLLAGAITLPVALALVYSIVRSATRQTGSFSGDIFTASVAMIPLSIVCVSMAILGIKNLEVLIIEAFAGICMTVMLLFAGSTRISGFSERAALFTVPIALLLSAWASKVVTMALL